MKKNELSEMTCSVANSLAMIGDPWILLIVRELMLGNRRFDGIQKQTCMSTNSLTTRLKGLEEEQVIEKSAYQDRPIRYEYRLTQKGIDLWPVLVTLAQWGDKWCRTGDKPMRYRHKTCSHIADPKLVCGACGEGMTPFESEGIMSKAMEQERLSRN